MFLDPLSWHSGLWHACLTLLLDTIDRTLLLARQSCWTLLLDTLSWHSFLDTLTWHSCAELLLDTPAAHHEISPKGTIQASKTSVFHETFTKSENTSFQNERFPRDFHQKWEYKLPKRAFSTRLWQKVRIRASKRSIFHEAFTKSENPKEHFPRGFHQKWESKLPKRAFYTRLSPKMRIQASKTSIFHETFTKSDNPSFQNEHFTWDFSQKRTSEQTICIANPNVTAWSNTSKTPLWNCKSQCHCDANVSLSRNPAPVQRNHCFQP